MFEKEPLMHLHWSYLQSAKGSFFVTFCGICILRNLKRKSALS
jgi:hypothetical protein